MKKAMIFGLLFILPVSLVALPTIYDIKQHGILTYKMIENAYNKANKGDIFSQALLGEGLVNGTIGLLPNYKRAIFWLRKAEKSCDKNSNQVGCAIIYSNLAILHLLGYNSIMPQSRKDFYRLTKKALKTYNKLKKSKTYTPSQRSVINYYIGEMYFWGIPGATKQNLPKAFSLFLSSANNGYIHSVKKVALMYRYGLGTKKNPYKAHIWYKLLAQTGWREAQYIVGMNHLKGSVGVKKDSKEAAKWLWKAAVLGYYPAIIELVKLHEKGLTSYPIPRKNLTQILEKVSLHVGEILGKFPVMRL